MKTTRKQAVINKLWKAVTLLSESHVSIVKLNEKGKQFDFVTDPALADIVNRINNVVKMIDGNVYQKRSS